MRPDAVRAYLALSQSDDPTAAAVAFADDAHVTDDGHYHHGRAAIREWLGRTSAEFDYTSTPIGGDDTTVTCRVEGNFPGSPVDLDHRFELDGSGRISRLEIGVH
ncbi:nuclear transport factor 2 family protein [Herbidospora yilanensis]|uniref:nuclear transport factor 2 family protein n=1 Tax=Herbidospora yilanensis TaxID=354426 RepID=UPI0007808346|nr:nuclear transport factor 2 family protein [Herbidospora yilanensis]